MATEVTRPATPASTAWPTVVAVAAVAGWSLVLLTAAPLLLTARLLLLLPGLPAALRAQVRLTLLAGAYLATVEIPALLALRRGPAQGTGALLRRVLGRFYGSGLALAGLRLSCAHPPELGDRPVIVLARHAGVFNSPLVLHLVASQLGRTPHTIAKRSAALTPGTRRLYRASRVAFFDFGRQTGKVAALLHLKRLASTAEPSDAIVIFPEGANYSAARRRRLIAALGADGHTQLAGQATRMRHTLHPHPGGVRFTAAHAPHADIVILAHTGLEDLLAGWGRIDYPITTDGIVHVAWWHIPSRDIPRAPEAFAAWLGERWLAADRWIGSVRAETTGNHAWN
ncbi:1-acyl-sn-glycerol-3-phosphate acyltransferase [Longispora albida]|uniref:1-acyl-sn-glycerol-3-phosphate acyltransferase n=1 Tax=Longispora albida TaxID=203523 RepID=UPI000366DBE6|nr:1-acyl-sn-glycerol-3-phosphate acyltransferase [Longispora albida]